MFSRIKKVGLYFLIIFNLLISIIAVKAHTNNSKMKSELTQMATNQKTIVSMMNGIAENQENILKLTLMNEDVCYSVSNLLDRFHKDADIVEDTRQRIKGCKNED